MDGGMPDPATLDDDDGGDEAVSNTGYGQIMSLIVHLLASYFRERNRRTGAPLEITSYRVHPSSEVTFHITECGCRFFWEYFAIKTLSCYFDLKEPKPHNSTASINLFNLTCAQNR